MQVTREREREQAELREILKAIEFLLAQKAILENLLQKALQKAGLSKNLENKTLNLETLKAKLNNLPTPPANGWDRVRLETVCKMYQPQTISGKEILEQGQYKVYGANGVIGFYDKYNHKDAEVAMTCRGATCGTINYTEPQSWITGNAMVITPLDNNVILKKFLVYILPLSNIKNVITGSAQPQITRSNLSSLKIPLPPLEIQEQIISLVETIQTHITRLDEAKNTLATQKQNILKDAL